MSDSALGASWAFPFQPVLPPVRRPLLQHKLEVGQGKLSQEQAALILACYVAEAIIEGREEPYEGARCIWWEIANAVDPTPDRLLSFVGEASEYEDCSPYDERGKQSRREIEQQITSDAHELLVSAGDSWR